MERRGVSFVGLAKPIQQAMFVCGFNYNQDEQGPTKSKRKRCYRCTVDRKSARIGTKCKKPFVLTILPKLKKSNVDLHASYRNYMWFSRNLRHLQEMQKTVGLWLNKNETI